MKVSVTAVFFLHADKIAKVQKGPYYRLAHLVVLCLQTFSYRDV